jgi:ATP-binding cassette subfamily C (CFTR/MRP) protein 1
VPSIGVFIGVYAAVCVVTWLTNLGVIIQVLIRIGSISAIFLHQILVKTTFNAPMSFFESTDTSILINKFSQDMSVIEMPLPINIWQLMNGEFVLDCGLPLLTKLAGTRVVINIGLLSSGSTFMILTMPFVLIILYWTQFYYLRTSRQIRLLDLEAKSPLYRHFTETLEGLATVRALGWQEAFEKEAIDYLEESRKPNYIQDCIMQWLSTILELLSASLAVTLTAMALLIPSSSSAGSLGVGLTTVIFFTGALNGLINRWTSAESALGSIARTRTFAETVPNENKGEVVDPGNDWPVGKLEASGITVIYKDETTALRKVNFAIEKGQKLGICGRTGR